MALAGTVLLVLAAPFVGVVRSSVQAAFPARFSLIVSGVIGIAALAVGVTAWRRIRQQRLQRYAMLVASACMAGLFVWWTGSADPSIRAVEAFHFVEYGAITYLFHRAGRGIDDGSALVLPALAAFAVGIIEEAYQWFLPARVGELKDVWLNAVAIACGVMVSWALAPTVPSRAWSADATRRTGGMLAAVVVLLAAFVHVVHLGVEISDSERSFLSRYSERQLADAAAARRDLWRAAPPLVRPDRLSREDQYMTEGLQHVQARNRAWAAGNTVEAWHENAILERHFAVVLDTPSYVAKAGHRWSPEQREEAGRYRAIPGAEPFRSRAFPYPIYTQAPLTVWAAAVALAAGVVVASTRAQAPRTQ